MGADMELYEQSEDYQLSIDRLTRAHQELAEKVELPDLAGVLDEDISTTDISELNHEAHRIEGVTEGMDRFLTAKENNSAALGQEFGDAERLEAIQSVLDKTPDEMASECYDLEQITPEISRYILAHQLKHEDQGLEFDEQARMQAIQVMPGTADDIAFAAWQIEKTLSPETLEAANERLTAEAIQNYKNDYNEHNNLPYEEAKAIHNASVTEPPAYDVVGEGAITVEGVQLSSAFQQADAHIGDQSLETIRNELAQAPEAQKIGGTEAVYQVAQV